MGQVINVEVKDVGETDVRQFVMDRGLTGMGLMRYYGPDDAPSGSPSDTLARALFAVPGVATIFVYDNIVSVTKVDERSWDEVVPAVVDRIRNLFIAYDVNRV